MYNAYSFMVLQYNKHEINNCKVITVQQQNLRVYVIQKCGQNSREARPLKDAFLHIFVLSPSSIFMGSRPRLGRGAGRHKAASPAL